MYHNPSTEIINNYKLKLYLCLLFCHFSFVLHTYLHLQNNKFLINNKKLSENRIQKMNVSIIQVQE